MYPQLTSYLQKLDERIADIRGHRKQKLEEIADFLRASDSPRVTFICTHNSRRSQLCQVWAMTIAHYFDFKGLRIYSGGTEVTAFHPNAVEALRRTGFRIKKSTGENPLYSVYFAEKAEPLQCFSKTYDDDANPRKDFAAVMTCSVADRNCPFVPGCALRVHLPYEDPKGADGTPKQQRVYDERCRQIATEMYYMIRQVSYEFIKADLPS